MAVAFKTSDRLLVLDQMHLNSPKIMLYIFSKYKIRSIVILFFRYLWCIPSFFTFLCLDLQFVILSLMHVLAYAIALRFTIIVLIIIPVKTEQSLVFIYLPFLSQFLSLPFMGHFFSSFHFFKPMPCFFIWFRKNVSPLHSYVIPAYDKPGK